LVVQPPKSPRHEAQINPVGVRLQNPLQHRLSAVQVASFGRHAGVVVEVLVEVVLVVLVVGAAVVVVVVVVSHGPRWSPWRRWLSTALWETSLVSSSGVPGLWQMVTFCC
jgi:hypothetical protein